MIGSLKGVVKHKQPPQLLLDVNGVGYELDAPMTTFYELPEVGAVVDLHTHLVVREDAQLLYAFSRVNQRNLFRLLLKVNGIGPRVALAILSTLTTEEFVQCVHFEDVAQLVRVPGIGKKTAERVLIDMRDKVKGLAETLQSSDGQNEQIELQKPSSALAENDALSALESLGYKQSEAQKIIKMVLKASEGMTSSEELIRSCLKMLSNK